MTPTRLGPGTNPGGLVAVLYDEADAELDRALIGGEDPAAAARRHAEQVIGTDRMVVVYDGDGGRPLVALTADAVIVFGP